MLAYPDLHLGLVDATIVTRERPDVVIQEIVGRHLYNFIPSPELVPK